jgi:hypothetical protein
VGCQLVFCRSMPWFISVYGCVGTTISVVCVVKLHWFFNVHHILHINGQMDRPAQHSPSTTGLGPRSVGLTYMLGWAKPVHGFHQRPRHSPISMPDRPKGTKVYRALFTTTISFNGSRNVDWYCRHLVVTIFFSFFGFLDGIWACQRNEWPQTDLEKRK